MNYNIIVFLSYFLFFSVSLSEEKGELKPSSEFIVKQITPKFLQKDSTLLNYGTDSNEPVSYLINDINIIYFLNATCPCTLAHIDYLVELRQKYPMFNFLAFHTNGDLDKKSIFKFTKKNKLNFPIYEDKNLVWANMLNALRTPQIFILNANREIIFTGPALDTTDVKEAKRFYLDDKLTDLLKNKNARNQLTQYLPLGCFIKR